MNMLQIQDALKGASDAHLMQEMQNPSGSAPQFLVLSEMKRRKDMRSQQQSAPQGTVADELTQAAQPREVLPLNEREPEYEDEEEEMAAGGLVGLRRYAEGGIVRMQRGGLAGGYSQDELFGFLQSGQPPTGYTMADVQAALMRPGSASIGNPGGFGISAPPLPSRAPIERLEVPRVQLPRNPSRAILGALPPLSEVEAQAGELEREQRVTDVLRRQEGAALQAERASDINVRARENAINDIRGRISGGTPAEEAIRSALPGYRGVTEAEMRQAFGMPQLTPSQPAAQTGQRPLPAAQPPVAQAEPPANSVYPSGDQEPAQPDPARPQAQPPASPAGTPRPAGGRGAAPAGLPGIRAAQASTGPSAQGAGEASPNPQISDRLAPILDRIREGRTDPGERRSEAMNMALIEAGLRIAGSKSPRLAGAISEGGVPALQAFSQQSQQIRQDQRQDLRDELQTAMAQNTNDFQRGRLSQQEYATRQQYLLGMARLEQDRNSSGAANSIARDRLELERSNRVSLRDYLDAPPERRELMDRFIGRGRDPNQAVEVQTLRNAADPQGSRREQAREAALINPATRNGARTALMMSGNRNPTDSDIDNWIISRIGVATNSGTLPVSRQPVGNGPVVQPAR